MPWSSFFEEVRKKEYATELKCFLDEEYKTKVVFPPRDLMFNAFSLTPLENVKVVIIGQDPYHEPYQAMGLAFSVPGGTKTPPSLMNIYKEIEMEYNVTLDKDNGDLTYLAKQGVLLLNAYLSVVIHKPLSHAIKEYDLFLQDVMSFLDHLNQPIVFILWGGFAKKYAKLLENPHHLVLKANHPSPLSANRGGFFGCNHFILTNKYLSDNCVATIDWIGTKKKL